MGSEMCIRDRCETQLPAPSTRRQPFAKLTEKTTSPASGLFVSWQCDRKQLGGFIEIYSAFPATGRIGTSEIAGTACVSRAIGYTR